MIQEPRKPDSIPRLEAWRTGESLSGAKLNRGVDAVNRLVQGLRPVRQIIPTPRGGRGGTVERMVIVREITDSMSMFIVVQEIKPNNTAPWDGGFVTEGEAVTVNVWPGMVAGDFAPFVWASDPSDLMTVLPLSRQHDSWWLKQLPKWAVSARKGPLKVVDCTGVEVPA